jgi:hypothetical protein
MRRRIRQRAKLRDHIACVIAVACEERSPPSARQPRRELIYGRATLRHVWLIVEDRIAEQDDVCHGRYSSRP